MSYERALAKASEIVRRHAKPGLQALGAESKRVRAKNPRSIRGSINVEACQREVDANGHAWDFGIGHTPDGKTDRMIWVEVHSADSKHVQVILDKQRALVSFLRAHAHALHTLPAAYVWLATGPVYLSPASAERRRIAQAGIVLKASPIELDR